mmetsp:Transcript_95761/g.214382  ORF Transcript_95761/g.214382 Transcript_95761/m.214382 type:complete len:337 (-) Transcript_95761:52-1062(-)
MLHRHLDHLHWLLRLYLRGWLRWRQQLPLRIHAQQELQVGALSIELRDSVEGIEGPHHLHNAFLVALEAVLGQHRDLRTENQLLALSAELRHIRFLEGGSQLQQFCLEFLLRKGLNQILLQVQPLFYTEALFRGLRSRFRNCLRGGRLIKLPEELAEVEALLPKLLVVIEGIQGLHHDHDALWAALEAVLDEDYLLHLHDQGLAHLMIALGVRAMLLLGHVQLALEALVHETDEEFLLQAFGLHDGQLRRAVKPHSHHGWRFKWSAVPASTPDASLSAQILEVNTAHVFPEELPIRHPAPLAAQFKGVQIRLLAIGLQDSLLQPAQCIALLRSEDT